MSKAVAAAAPASEAAVQATAPVRTLAVGWLAMLPMFLAYELALAHFGGARRNTSELLVGFALRPLAEHAALARWIGLGAIALLALILCRVRGVAVVPGVARTWLEGLLIAVVLGPALVFGLRALGRELDIAWNPAPRPPELADAAMLFGGAAWEELLFRVGLYSFVYWLALRTCTAVELGAGLARVVAEAAGLVLSSLAFALAHFEPCTRWLGPGGRPFDPASFGWFALAGAVLGLVFRWRGAGVAACAHGLFNVALWIGVDPDVIT